MTYDDGLTHEENCELIRVYAALRNLQAENPMWETNLRKFSKADTQSRLRWWLAFKQQAVTGAPAPKLLLARVTHLRLTT